MWNKLNLAWSGFFAACGAVNVYVAFQLSQETWVNFKVFGLLGLTVIFTLLTGIYLYKHLPKQEEK